MTINTNFNLLISIILNDKKIRNGTLGVEEHCKILWLHLRIADLNIIITFR